MGTIFRLDVATPNIPYTVYEQLQDDARVERAVPAALGDAYQGFRYVGTATDYFAAAPWRRKTFSVAAGRFWSDDPPGQPSYEAVLGAEVAQRTGLQDWRCLLRRGGDGRASPEGRWYFTAYA